MPKKTIGKVSAWSDNGVTVSVGENASRTGARIQLFTQQGGFEATVYADLDPEDLHTLGSMFDKLREAYPREL